MNKKQLCKDIGGFLKAYGEARGLTRLELSIKLRYKSCQTISEYERGRCGPPMGKLKTIARVLKIDKEAFAGIYGEHTRMIIMEKFK